MYAPARVPYIHVHARMYIMIYRHTYCIHIYIQLVVNIGFEMPSYQFTESATIYNVCVLMTNIPAGGTDVPVTVFIEVVNPESSICNVLPIGKF